MKRLYDLFLERDGEFLEINPIVLTEEGYLVAQAAKVKFDASAEYR